MRIFLDITRIASRVFRSTPTGIDRTEFWYAKELLNSTDHRVTPVITTPLFTGALSLGLAREIMTRIEAAWAGESQSQGPDLETSLTPPPDLSRRSTLRVRNPPVARILRESMRLPISELLGAHAALKREVSTLNGQPAAYIHISHTQLEKTARFHWLKKANIHPVFFIHDAIPVDYPEFCSPGSAARHLGRLDTVANLGHLLLVNSQYTADRVSAHIRENKWHLPKISVVPLGLEPAFFSHERKNRPSKAHPYFVSIGTIEPRKNLQFLLAVWRSLIEKLGSATPRLVIVGRRGWENENILDLLERSHFLAPYVVEMSDLSDTALVSLLAGAKGLLAPSFVEGFGLPVVEAIALPVPVIASDIEAHQEVSSGMALLLHPTDGPAWLHAITELSIQAENPDHKFSRTPRTMTWQSHVSLALKQVAILLEEQRSRGAN
jgi:glycosyltransferase involved in cell wall biosynthesis